MNAAEKKELESGQAILSEDRVYRYALSRVWGDPLGPKLLVVGLNPSTADESRLDPTMRRCIRFAQREGYAGLWMGNLFAFRATHPLTMKVVAEPVGDDNDAWLSAMARWCGVGNVLFAWGAHGGWMGRDREVAELLKEYGPRCFGRTKSGHPKHPLYLSSTTPLIDYEAKS